MGFVSTGLYLLVICMYFAGWCIAAASLAAVQSSCSDNSARFLGFQSNSLLAGSLGDNCNKLLRHARG